MSRQKSPAKPSLPKSASRSAAAKFPKVVREFWENLTWSDLTDRFGTKTAQRGRDYADSHQVETLWATEDGKNLLGIVQGTEEYQTVVSIEKGRRKNQFILVSACSCPVGADCKHGVAVIGTFLDILAHDKPILGCTELKDGVWEITSPTGKKSALKIDIEDDVDEDDDGYWSDDWEEEDDDFPPRKRIRRTTKVATAERNFKPEALRKKLNAQQPEELVDLIMQLAEDHPTVRKQFEQELFVESVSKKGKSDQLVREAVEMIDQGLEIGNFGYYGGHYGGGPSADLDSVTELVKQCKKTVAPLPVLDKIVRHLLKKGGRFLEATGAEDDYEFREVFDTVAKVLLASKSDPVKIILWSYEMDALDQFAMIDDMEKTLQEHSWSSKVWSDVADKLIAEMDKKSSEPRNRRQLKRIVSALDKGKRREEATDLLRKEAPKRGEQEMLADRLIEVGCLDEAEKIAVEQLRKRLPSISKNDFHDRDWMRRLKTVAEKRKDRPTLASIQAAEFFRDPERETILPLLKTAKMLNTEPIIRRGIDTFLLNGELPAAVTITLAGKKSSPTAKKDWPIPVFFFQPKPDTAGSRYDVLCEWAITENRHGDVVRWFDALKNKPSQKRRVDVFEVAEAVISSHPGRAFEIYRKAAEEEMDTTSTSHYPMAISHLRKAKLALEKAKRGREWAKIIKDIRTKHRRKSSLMKLLDELEAGPIVKQKRR